MIPVETLHSDLSWTFDDPVNDKLIQEIVRIVWGFHILSGKKRYAAPIGYVPMCTVDYLARDVGRLIDDRGFADDAINTVARESADPEKMKTTLSLVRGSMFQRRLLDVVNPESRIELA
jgi:hypothetical protein